MFRRAALCLFVVACGGGGGSSTGIDISALECPPESTLTYENYGRVVIEDYCLSCHASDESPRLVSAEQVRASKNQILRAAVASTAMPEGTSMTLEERQLLGEWLACGAP